MTIHKPLVLIAAGLALSITQVAEAAPAPNAKLWSGTWKLNSGKSKFSSPDYTPKSDTRTYAVAGNRVTMRSTMVNAAGKTIKWSYSATTDGKWYPTSGNPNTDRVALTLVSPREFKSRTTLKGKPSARSTVTVSADGKQLTIARSILIAKGGPTDDRMVFDRAK